MSRIAEKPDAREFLQMVGGSRCPCGHLAARHRKPTGAIEGERFGDCRDCDCRGLVDCTEDDSG